MDGGITWSPMALGDDRLRVRFWYPDFGRPGRVFAGLDDGLAVTENDGDRWTRIATYMGRARGLFLDPADPRVYAAFAYGIHVSRDGGASFTLIIPATFLHRFAGGRNGTSSSSPMCNIRRTPAVRSLSAARPVWRPRR